MNKQEFYAKILSGEGAFAIDKEIAIDMLNDIDRLSDLVKRLKEDGEQWFDLCDHDDTCSVYDNPLSNCDCGYEELAIVHRQLMAEIEKK